MKKTLFFFFLGQKVLPDIFSLLLFLHTIKNKYIISLKGEFFMTNELHDILTSDSPWSAEEELIIFSNYQKNHDQRLKNMIILKNLGLIRKFSAQYTNMGVDIEDLQQEAVFGLMTAVDYFDLNKGCKFSTYASNWIQQSMTRYIFNHKNNIRIPVYVLELKRKINALTKQYREQYGTDPSIEYLAESLEMKPQKVEFVLEKIRTLETVSLNTLVTNENAKKDTELMDLLCDQYTPSIEDAVLEKIQAETLVECMADVLNPREYQILILRYGLNDDRPHTLEEVGNEFGLTRERIRQIERGALNKLEKCPKLRKQCRGKTNT